jgi:hypothetical protein
VNEDGKRPLGLVWSGVKDSSKEAQRVPVQARSEA